MEFRSEHIVIRHRIEAGSDMSIYSPPRPNRRDDHAPFSSPVDVNNEHPAADDFQPYHISTEPLFSSPQSQPAVANRRPGAWVNTKLNSAIPSNGGPSVSAAAAAAGGVNFRRLPAAAASGATTLSAAGKRRPAAAVHYCDMAPTVALVPTAAEMVAIRQIVAREDANPANPSQPFGAFSATGHRSSPLIAGNNTSLRTTPVKQQQRPAIAGVATPLNGGSSTPRGGTPQQEQQQRQQQLPPQKRNAAPSFAGFKPQPQQQQRRPDPVAGAFSDLEHQSHAAAAAATASASSAAAAAAAEPRTPTPDELDVAINEAYERQMRVAAATRQQAVQSEKRKFSGSVAQYEQQQRENRPLGASRVFSSASAATASQPQQQSQTYQQQQRQRPTYIMLDKEGRVSDATPPNAQCVNTTAAAISSSNTGSQQQLIPRYLNPRGKEFRAPLPAAERDANDGASAAGGPGGGGHVTYVVTHGHSFENDGGEQSLEDAYLNFRRQELASRPPIFSPSMPRYFKPKKPKLSPRGDDRDGAAEYANDSNRDEENDSDEGEDYSSSSSSSEARRRRRSARRERKKKEKSHLSKNEQLLEKQFGVLQKQLMENNKQVQAVAEERLQIMSRACADVEDQVRQERSNNQQLQVELATAKITIDTLQLTLSSERDSFVKDRDAIRKDHAEHIKALEADWTAKINKANADIAKFLAAAEFDNEQHLHQTTVLTKRLRDMELEARELQAEVALQKEGARRAALLVHKERQDADDRIVAAANRADGAHVACAGVEVKLTAQVKHLQMQLEASLSREAELESELNQLMRRCEEMKLQLHQADRSGGDARAMLEVERERTRALSAQLDSARMDHALAENERESRRILERQNDELERQLSEMKRTVSQLMAIAAA